MAISGDSRTAYVTLQENNAVAVIDIPSAKLAGIWSLGLKDWAGLGLQLDASDKDDAINFKSWPVLGCYMPDSIASYEVDGKTYLVVANEGDSREYGEDEDNPVLTWMKSAWARPSSILRNFPMPRSFKRRKISAA